MRSLSNGLLSAATNGNAIYGTRGVGLVKNPDGSETGKTKKGDRVYEITIPKGCAGYPVVK